MPSLVTSLFSNVLLEASFGVPATADLFAFCSRKLKNIMTAQAGRSASRALS